MATKSTNDSPISGVERFSRRQVLASGGGIVAATLFGSASLLRPSTASAATYDYYISPTGSDSNPGTSSAPWALTALSSKPAIAGKRIGLLDGTYRLTSGWAGSNLDFIQAIAFGGTAALPTTIEAVNFGKAVLTSNDGAGNYPQFGSIGLTGLLQINASYVTLRGLRITDLAGHGVNIDASFATIDSCEIDNIKGNRNLTVADTNCGAIYFKDTALAKTGTTVTNCLIHDIQHGTVDGNGFNGATFLPFPRQYSNGVGDLFGVSSITIANCTFYNIACATYLKTNTGNVTFRNNFVYNCGSMMDCWTTVGSSPGNPSTNNIYNNIAVVNHIGGAPSANNNGAAAAVTAIYNNTFYLKAVQGNDDAAAYGYLTFAGAGVQDLRFYNNIVAFDATIASANTGVLRMPSGTQNPGTRFTVMNFNCYSRFQMTDNVNSVSYTSLSQWQSASSRDTGSMVSDPLISNAAATLASGFKLLAGSPCIGKGRVSGQVAGAATDIGAWGGGSTQIGSTVGTGALVPVAPNLVGVG